MEKAQKKAEEERKRQEAEERKLKEEEEEKQRVEEQKRREEEMRPKFDGMFSDSKQLTQQQMVTLRGFLEQYRGQFKSWKLLYRATEHEF